MSEVNTDQDDFRMVPVKVLNALGQVFFLRPRNKFLVPFSNKRKKVVERTGQYHKNQTKNYGVREPVPL